MKIAIFNLTVSEVLYELAPTWINFKFISFDDSFTSYLIIDKQSFRCNNLLLIIRYWDTSTIFTVANGLITKL